MNTSKNILVLTYWDFNDALIKTYTLPYVKIISESLMDNEHIYLLTLNKKRNENLFYHPKIHVLSYRYFPFGLFAFFYYSWMLCYLWYFILVKKITHIHAWCTPAGVFGYILSVLTGRKLIIDSYEPHAESMVEVGEWKKNSMPHKILFWFEKKLTHRAQFLIATTEGMIKEYAVSRYNYNPNKKNWFVKPACVDVQLFQPHEEKRKLFREQLGLSSKIVGVYAGKLGGIYLEEEVFRWLKFAQHYWNEKFVFIFLSSHPTEYFQNMFKKHSINQKSVLHFFVPHAEVVNYLNIADFALTPVKPVYTKKFCSPIKNGEYWAMGLPVITTGDISVDSDIIEKEQAGYVLKDLNDREFLNSVKTIDELLKNINKSKIIQLAIKHRNFSNAQKIYEIIYKD